ncbi:GAF domain-containing protein [uncultured Rhodoblastus sp.]|uniref:GAF domain-containing protein n=1 Tax=uncultured Rhodoblastus sp. TaxID=543037 RepID=UPI0025E54382|nr:GAF domain-containing protein [uncultured Rhodoblastus sp.]
MSEAPPPDQTAGLCRQGPAFGGVDLTSCDREPIHISGSVQPHGALVAFDPLTLRVVHAGGDTLRVFGIAPVDLLGQSMEAQLPPDRWACLRSLLVDGALPGPMHAFVVPAKRDARDMDAIVHFSGGLVVLEFEPLLERLPDDAMVVVQAMLLRVQQAATSRALCQTIVEQVRRVTGFDRVMLYRFLPDGSGAVDAEARDEISESFLGLHYPASDIPRQARALYLKNWIRIIPDTGYKPAPIAPALNPANGQPLDLSFSVLRSVSPIHIEYLANMGVAASMSLSIVMGGELWGLIACHHRTPHFLPHRLRMACELFAQMASSKLEAKVAAEQFDAQIHCKRLHEELIKNMSQEADLTRGLTRYRPNLLDYIPADGVGLWLDGQFTRLGNTPDPEQVAALISWLNETVADGVFCTDRLPLLYPPAEAFADVASGLIAFSVSKTPRDYVLWFRTEFLQTVTWAGNPDKPLECGPNGDRLTPRKSFAAWREAVKLQSRPWRSAEIEAAQVLRLSLLEVVLRRIDQLARERAQAQLTQAAMTIELDRRLHEWQAVAKELKEEAERRTILESELSRVRRSAFEDQEAERRRIARELHDTLGQTLTLMQLGLDGLSRASAEDAPSQVAALKAIADGVGSEVNRLAWELRPTALDDLGLDAAVRHLTHTWSKRSDLRFGLHLTLEDRRLAPAVETALYRVLQEAIINIVRHAEATKVDVLLDANDTEVRMIIEDNGRGFSTHFEPSDPPSERLGLLGIRERLSLVSGRLEVESAPGQGCTLFVTAPL